MAAPGSTRPANAGRFAPLGAARCRRTGLAGLWRGAGLPVAVSALSGIYGPGRNALINLANGTARRLVKPGQVFNRIHVADIAGALSHLAQPGAGARLQRHRRPAGAAAGCRRLCRELDGDRAAARNSVRDRPTFANGAVILRREQARFEPPPASGFSRRAAAARPTAKASLPLRRMRTRNPRIVPTPPFICRN